jgi:preprotein translocase subunit SecD
MNKYPPWKYALIFVALLVSILYAAPNLFGEVPAVQVSGIRASTKIDATMQAGLEAALKAANITPTATEPDEAALRFRFADTDTQLKARDVIQSKVGPG